MWQPSTIIKHHFFELLVNASYIVYSKESCYLWTRDREKSDDRMSNVHLNWLPTFTNPVCMVFDSRSSNRGNSTAHNGPWWGAWGRERKWLVLTQLYWITEGIMWYKCNERTKKRRGRGRKKAPCKFKGKEVCLGDLGNDHDAWRKSNYTIP